MPQSDTSAEKSGYRDEGHYAVGEAKAPGSPGDTAGSGSKNSSDSSNAMDTVTPYVAPRTCTVVDEGEAKRATRKSERHR